MPFPQQVVALMHNLLRSEQGISKGLSNLTGHGENSLGVKADQILPTQLPTGILAQESLVQYPRFQVYCERIDNELKEKFNRFSGVVQIAIEIHYSHERPEILTPNLQVFVQAVTDTIESGRGILSPGIFLPGKYKVGFDTPKAGGRGVIQSAKVSIPIEVTRA